MPNSSRGLRLRTITVDGFTYQYRIGSKYITFIHQETIFTVNNQEIKASQESQNQIRPRDIIFYLRNLHIESYTPQDEMVKSTTS